MEKRLTKSDFVFILVFIFMLIFALGAFFFGVKTGTDRTELKYADLVKQKKEEKEGLVAYHQSYLVSFYHTVYLPFREFNLKWAQDMDDIANDSGTDGSSLLKGLSKLSDDKYQAMLTQTMPEASPLLVEAHAEYLKSLKLFSDAAKSMQSKANNLSPTVLLGEIEKDAYFNEAKNYALAAQSKYFDSIVLWQQSMDSTSKGLDALGNKEFAFNDWSQLSINLKNAYVARTLAADKQFYAFTPQDVTFGVDDMIRSGQAKKLNASTASQVMDILISTRAVRQGDFVKGKAKYYGGELLPQLPFFSKIE